MSVQIKGAPQTEFSEQFVQGMADRMAVSYYKYGPVMDAIGKIDEIASLEKRLQKYKETGNTEWLIDVANFAMIEYMHRGAEAFRATESHESPGLIHATEAKTGHVTDSYVAGAHADFYKGKHE